MRHTTHSSWDGPVATVTLSKQQLCPQGPCRREMEDTLNHLKFLNVLSPRGVHIPNCDKKGFYKKKQVSGVPRDVVLCYLHWLGG